MSNYIPGGQKKTKIFKKRERELLHALKNSYPEERVIRAVEKLRHAKIQSLQVQQPPRNLSRDEYLVILRDLLDKWESYSVDDVVDKYRSQLRSMES